MRRRRTDAGHPRARVPRRGLRAPVGAALDVLPRQVPLLDRPGAPARDRRPPRGDGGARRARCHPARGPRARRRAARSGHLACLGLPFVIVRGQAKEYGTANRLEGTFSPGSGSASSRTSSRAAGRLPRPLPPCARPVSNARMRSASSIARRAAPTLSRASPCACGRCFERPTSRTPPKIPAKPAWLSQSDSSVRLTAT